MNEADALRIVRELALDSGKVVITDHATERMYERGFSRLDVLNCLGKGVICEGPYMGAQGDWIVNMQRHAAGEPMQIVVAIHSPNLIIITAF